MTIWDYPVTTPFGQVAGYPLNNGFHNGIDYGAPVGTDVTVNGIPIAKSGATGGPNPVKGFGPHCHVGHWSGNTVLDPGIGGGKSLQGAVVTEVHPSNDTNNGIYVRVGVPDGTNWVFLHLSQILVKVGDKLEGATMDSVPDDSDIINAKRAATGVPNYQPTGGEFDYYKERDANGKPVHGWHDLLYDTMNGMTVQIEQAKKQGVNHDTALKYVQDNLG